MPDPTTTPQEWIDEIRALRSPLELCDPQDADDETITHSPAWYRARNRQHAIDNIPPRYADAALEREDVYQWLLTALTDPKDAPSLLLAGITGTGKTHLAYAALRLAGESGHKALPWVATSTAALYGDLRPSGKRDSEAVFAKVLAAPLLLLDDLGAAKTTEWTEEITYRLIDHRYNHCLPSIFTTNARAGELTQILGDRIGSRLTEMCQKVVIAGTDRRRTPTAPGLATAA
jgi:DNA replication protein DnaC